MIGDDILVSVLKSFAFDTSPPQPARAPLTRIERLQRQMRPDVYRADDTHLPVAQIEDTSFPTLLIELLQGVHASNNKQLHSICMGDIARKSVNFYTRHPDNDKTYWQSNTKDMSIRKLQSHARELYKFIIEAVTASLKPAYINGTKEFVWVLKTDSTAYAVSTHPLILQSTEIINEDEDEDDVIAMMSNFYSAHNERMGSTIVDESPSSPENGLIITPLKESDITDCLAGEYLNERKLLGSIIDNKKAHLLSKLHAFDLDSGRCATFFNESYPICIGSLKLTK